MRGQKSLIGLLSLLGCAALYSGCAAPAPDEAPDIAQLRAVTGLTELWTTTGLSSPESVILNAEQNELYVSNVGGDAMDKDGNGSISRVSLTGDIIEADWVIGTEALPLHAPKGMALSDGKLYVSDIDHLAVIDVVSGTVIARVPAQDAGFLNDVAATRAGILVSDSGKARIYQLLGDRLSPWLESEKLGGINGLHDDGQQLLITTMSSGELLSADWNTRTLKTLAAGMVNADGIGIVGDDQYIISSWPGQIWATKTGAAPTLLLDQSDTPINMNDLLLSGDTLYMPHWRPGSVSAYRVEMASE